MIEMYILSDQTQHKHNKHLYLIAIAGSGSYNIQNIDGSRQWKLFINLLKWIFLGDFLLYLNYNT